MFRAGRTRIVKYAASAFKSWDFYVGVFFGAFGGGITLDARVRDAAVPVVLAESAIGVALTATVFAAVAIFATFFDSSYRRVLDLAGGFRNALRPYMVVDAIAALSGGAGVIAALWLPALDRWEASVAVGVSTWLVAWAIAGTVSLVDITVFHATQRARLMSGADNAAHQLSEKRAASGR